MKKIVLAFLFLTLTNNVLLSQTTLESSSYPGLKLTHQNAQIRLWGESGEKWSLGSTGAPGDDLILLDILNDDTVRFKLDADTGYFGLGKFNGTIKPSSLLTVQGRGAFGYSLGDHNTGMTFVDWTYDKSWAGHADKWSGYIGFNAYRNNDDEKDKYKGINVNTNKAVMEGSNHGFRFLYRNRMGSDSVLLNELEEYMRIGNNGNVSIGGDNSGNYRLSVNGKARFGRGLGVKNAGLTFVDWTHDKNWGSHADKWSGYIGFNAYRDNNDAKDVFKGINKHTNKAVIEGSNHGFRFLYRNRISEDSESANKLNEVFKIDKTGTVFAKHNALSITGSNPKTSVYGFNNKIEFKNGGHGAIVYYPPGLEDELMFGMHQNGNFYWGHKNENSNDQKLVEGKYCMYLDADTSNLGIRGKLTASEVKVKINGWSDFVFEDTYKLSTLKEVQQYIQEKGHLKDIPSAKEVEENGIHLGEMDSKLLQKIEELTLYTIQQEKKISDLDKELSELKSIIKSLIKK